MMEIPDVPRHEGAKFRSITTSGLAGICAVMLWRYYKKHELRFITEAEAAAAR